MRQQMKLSPRATTLDDIYAYLFNQIATLQLAPNTKISEADIAAQFGVSRQPVRDAFHRLENDGLLLIRPQRATIVRPFSTRAIEKSRFVRRAVEKEVLYLAALHCDDSGKAELDEAITQQKQIIKLKDYSKFNQLDYNFHKIFARIAKAEFAFDVIMQEKSKVDRLCVLSLSNEDRMPELVDDHVKLAEAVKAHDASKAVEILMLHLGRLDETITQIYQTNQEFFED